jgi:hypothetical protein
MSNVERSGLGIGGDGTRLAVAVALAAARADKFKLKISASNLWIARPRRGLALRVALGAVAWNVGASLTGSPSAMKVWGGGHTLAAAADVSNGKTCASITAIAME